MAEVYRCLELDINSGIKVYSKNWISFTKQYNAYKLVNRKKTLI